MTLDEFNALPVIMSFFPLTFITGNQRWTKFSVACNNCRSHVPTELTRGHVDQEVLGDYRINTVDYRVTAHALCPACNKLTTALYTLHEDMTISEHHSRTRCRSADVSLGSMLIKYWNPNLEMHVVNVVDITHSDIHRTTSITILNSMGQIRIITYPSEWLVDLF